MRTPSWPQLVAWAATADVRTLSGQHDRGDRTSTFLFEAPGLWWDEADRLGGGSLPQLLRLGADQWDRVVAVRVEAAVHDGRPAWRAVLADGTTWTCDDETGLGVRRERDGHVEQVLGLAVDAPLPAGLLATARAAADEADRERRLHRLVQEHPPPLPAFLPWRWQRAEAPGLVSLDGGSVGRAPLGEEAPVSHWSSSEAVRLERAGWSWAVQAQPPLTVEQAEQVVDGLVDAVPSWAPPVPEPAPGVVALPAAPAPGGPAPARQPGGRVLWEGGLHLHYGFWSLVSEHSDGGHEVRGQAQGLLSVAEQGSVRAMAGLHTGTLPLAVVLHDADPGVQPEWEDVVEASFTPYEPVLTLGAFEQFEEVALPPGTYRVRLSAVGMDRGREADTVLEDEEPVEVHRLDLWPEDAERPDLLVRSTSQTAAYWHSEV